MAITQDPGMADLGLHLAVLALVPLGEMSARANRLTRQHHAAVHGSSFKRTAAKIVLSISVAHLSSIRNTPTS
jgi:hypothetical protein